jgi:hypothetical protein
MSPNRYVPYQFPSVAETKIHRKNWELWLLRQKAVPLFACGEWFF